MNLDFMQNFVWEETQNDFDFEKLLCGLLKKKIVRKVIRNLIFANPL